jgi:hypothetical protein
MTQGGRSRVRTVRPQALQWRFVDLVRNQRGAAITISSPQ